MHPGLGILSTELSVIGFALLFICPPAGAACLATATVVAAAQLATDVVRRTRGEHVSATTLGLEAMAALPIGGKAFTAGRDAGRAVHALEELAPGARTVSRVVPGGGLAAHEAAGGHALEKHVGKSEEFLMQRLDPRGTPSAASSFYDRESAENCIASVLEDNSPEIQRWLAGSGGQLSINGRAAGAIGLVLKRTMTRPVEGQGVRLILRRSSAMTTNYYVHTAMVTL